MAKKSRKELNQALKTLDFQAQQQQQVGDLKQAELEPSDTWTRHKVALLFVGAYFFLLTILIIGIPLYNLFAFKVTYSENVLIIPLGDTVQGYSAIVGPALGFVIGYYFKTRNEN